MQRSPATFTQVNSQQTESLYQLVAEFASLSGQEVVWDLYSGAGIIALYLAKQASAVIGVENYSPAAANACQNAKLNGIENCRFIAGAAESVLPQLVADGFLADLVVLDLSLIHIFGWFDDVFGLLPQTTRKCAKKSALLIRRIFFICCFILTNTIYQDKTASQKDTPYQQGGFFCTFPRRLWKMCIRDR